MLVLEQRKLSSDSNKKIKSDDNGTVLSLNNGSPSWRLAPQIIILKIRKFVAIFRTFFCPQFAYFSPNFHFCCIFALKFFNFALPGGVCLCIISNFFLFEQKIDTNCKITRFFPKINDFLKTFNFATK